VHQQMNISISVQEEERKNNTMFVLLKIVLGLFIHTEGGRYALGVILRYGDEKHTCRKSLCLETKRKVPLGKPKTRR
jgi:hypothetical protein